MMSSSRLILDALPWRTATIQHLGAKAWALEVPAVESYFNKTYRILSRFGGLVGIRDWLAPARHMLLLLRHCLSVQIRSDQTLQASKSTNVSALKARDNSWSKAGHVTCQH